MTGPTETETLGVTGARTTWEVSATKSVSVELEVSATGGGLESQAGYKIEFGGSPSEGDNTLEAADPLDDKGPYVLYSEPEDDGFGPPAGGRIALNFNEPIDTAILLDGDDLALNPDAGEPVLTLSPDQRTLEVLYPGLLPAQSYTLTVPSVVRDLNGNHLDQDPLTTAEDSFVLTFETPPLVKSELGELDTGTGGVIVGQYAFVLEQKGPLNGALYVYDVGNPGSPVKVGELSVPGMPWDLTFIPDYSFIPAKDEEAVTKNLIAIVGGPVGAFQQYMWVVDISDPTAPTRLAGKLITPSSTAAVTQVKWSAPHLAMLQIDGDQNIVVIADLQEYIYSESLTEDDVTATDYPAAGQTGLDLNGDGDYVDEGEELPLPPKDYFLFHGWVRSHMLHDTNQAILDYHYDASRQFLGVVTTGGKQFLPGTGLATGPAVQPSYRTLVYQGLEGEALLP
ncbi:MAG: Ig-like domain-containing protein, partial [Myxococcota bacterium]|nr:Ig-like domain-containing protein [Myxococcota bacterium]